MKFDKINTLGPLVTLVLNLYNGFDFFFNFCVKMKKAPIRL